MPAEEPSQRLHGAVDEAVDLGVRPTPARRSTVGGAVGGHEQPADGREAQQALLALHLDQRGPPDRMRAADRGRGHRSRPRARWPPGQGGAGLTGSRPGQGARSSSTSATRSGRNGGPHGTRTASTGTEPTTRVIMPNCARSWCSDFQPSMRWKRVSASIASMAGNRRHSQCWRSRSGWGTMAARSGSRAAPVSTGLTPWRPSAVRRRGTLSVKWAITASALGLTLSWTPPGAQLTRPRVVHGHGQDVVGDQRVPGGAEQTSPGSSYLARCSR